MGCFTSKASEKSQPSCKQEKWWETNDNKITASALAESLFFYPSELFDLKRYHKRTVVDSSIKQCLLSAFWGALSNIQKQPDRIEERELSAITKIMESTGRFLRPIDVLVPRLLADQNVIGALRKAGLDAATVKKEFYKLHYRNKQKSDYKAVRKHCYDFLLKVARNENDLHYWDNQISNLIVILGMQYTQAAIVVGDYGACTVGVVEGLAQYMLQGRVWRTMLLDRSIVALDAYALTYRDNVDERSEKIILDVWKELIPSNTKVMLFIDDMDLLFDDAKTRMLLRYNIRRDRPGHQVQCIGTMVQDRYSRYILGDAGLHRKCVTISVRNEL